MGLIPGTTEPSGDARFVARPDAFVCVLCGLPLDDRNEILCPDCLEHELESEVHQ